MKKYLFYMLCFVLVACNEEGEQVQPDELVVEGYIDAGGHPQIMVHKAVQFDNKAKTYMEVLERNLILTAQVTISDGMNDYSLVGGASTNTLPPYIYKTAHLKGEADHTYLLSIAYKHLHVTAQTTIPTIVPIDSVTCQHYSNKSQTYDLKVHFGDDPSTQDYYALFYRVGAQQQFTIASMGVKDDAYQTSAHMQIPLNRMKTLLDQHDDLEFNFMPNDTVYIKLAHIDAITYDIWSSLTATSITNTWLFMPKANISTNIQGGRGYFCGYGADIRAIILPEKDTTFCFLN